MDAGFQRPVLLAILREAYIRRLGPLTEIIKYIKKTFTFDCVKSIKKINNVVIMIHYCEQLLHKQLLNYIMMT